MAGKRILLATEFLRGTATTARILPLAVALADRGHDVTLALPPSLTESAGFPLVAAPVLGAPPPPGFLAVTYADLLLLAGYGTTDSLRGLMTGWRAVLAQASPDLLIADFAPTAMLTARADGVAIAALGDGYTLPPPARPLPLLRPWADLPADAAADIEGRVLAVINALLPQRPMRGLRALFAGVPAFLCTFPELDHYPNRPDGSYFGEIFSPSRGPAPDWPAVSGERIYVDLDPRHPALGGLSSALARLGLPALIQSAPLAASANVRVTTTGNRTALLSGADIVVCQGKDVAAPALLAGKPLLMLPLFVEQMMTLHRVATQGLGHGIAPDADAEAIDAALRRLVDDRECRARAANFARLYDGYRPGIAIDAVADEINDLFG